MTDWKRPSFSELREMARTRFRTARAEATTAVKAWNESMLEDDAQGHYGTRWGRGGMVIVPTGVAIAGLAGAIVQGILAANFAVANTKFTLAAAHLRAEGLSAVVGQTAVKQTDGSTKNVGVLAAGIRSATIDGQLCILVAQPLPIGSYTLMVAAGGPGTKITVQNLVADATDLISKGRAVLGGATLGKSGDLVQFNGQSMGGAPGSFGLDLSNGFADLTDASITAYDGVVSGSLELPNAAITVSPGTKTSC